jgi:hypothetical protein
MAAEISNPQAGRYQDAELSDGQNAVLPDNTASAEAVYSERWRGHYSARQLEALDAIYARYAEDFVLDTVNVQDYARKAAKASLNADIAEDKFRRGHGSLQEYRDAQKIFDDLSKSSNFAACKRKPGETSGIGSLGEIILRIESGGALLSEGVKLPEDDIDRVLADFRHTLAATGLQSDGG